MPKQEYVNPETMAKPSGYTTVVKVDQTVYIAGQVSIAPDGSIVGKGDPEAQVRQVWANLEAAVKSVGGTRQNYCQDDDLYYQHRLHGSGSQG